MLALLSAVLVGWCTPAQTAVNARLRTFVGHPLMSSLISFAVGTLSLLVLHLILFSALLPPFGQAAGQPWWIWTGGVLGVIFLTGNIVLFPRLGGVETVVLPIVGQIAAAMVIDQWGVFGAQQRSLSVWRVLGAALVCFGVFIVVYRPGLQTGHAHSQGLWLWRALGVLAGVCTATQMAINGTLGVVLGSPISAALVSFSVGTVLLIVLVGALRAWPRKGTTGEGSWWMWFGGVLGAVYVAGAAALVPIIGAGVTVVAVLAGNMLMSQLIDATGALGARRIPVAARQIVGLIVIVLGVLAVRAV
ncbi:Uncharacterized protein conserved in bacteria [Corynebacterium renale]|uniref:DMT family transporter n=1 Tax=Corynebacterium renale TaxID=1724 RepID=UPI000DA2DFF9|nr:DMT family transporter [Corynebacterium renale]SQG64403.1 Uncharacterized protein conserved in bacteria [Corynebacterium renale]STC95169.1 Uncharacterized protein conserved in bacteria [Corynebacterium renale]